MSRASDSLKLMRKIVLTFDICSSTSILEDLHRTENIKVWRDFLIWLKRYLVDQSNKHNFELYNFTGDGWLILFDDKYQGSELMTFLDDLCIAFEQRYSENVVGYLETPPENIGISFGMDRGTLVRIVMRGRYEYVGRAINVACRLQGAIKDKDKKPGYKMLLTNHLYENIQNSLRNYKRGKATRTLRNIVGGKEINCVKVWLLSKKT